MARGPKGTGAAASGDGTVYLIHFDKPYKHARHYLGYTTDLPDRLEAHQDGRGARLMEVIKDAGITWRVARTWPGSRTLERAIKDRHNTPRLCPECTPQPQPVTKGRSAAQPGTQSQAQHPPQRHMAASSARVPEQEFSEWRAAGQVPPFERGAAQARLMVGRQIDAGLDADQIEAVNERMFRDYDPAVASPHTQERHRGYQAAAAELITACRQAQPHVGLHEPEVEIG